MYNNRQEMAENLENYLIGIDDIFAFKCRECGKCCKNRDDILLTARDIYNIAAKLNLTTTKVIEMYCEGYIGHDSRIPIVRLKPRGANKTCPLLKANHCIVHEKKPIVCALFPIGRVASMETLEEKLKPGTPLKISYINNHAACGSLKRKQTVRTWLESFGIPVEDTFFIKWNETIISLSNSMRQFEQKGATENSLELLWNGVATALYVAYDVKKEFMPQFEENSAKILDIISNLEKTFSEDIQS